MARGQARNKTPTSILVLGQRCEQNIPNGEATASLIYENASLGPKVSFLVLLQILEVPEQAPGGASEKLGNQERQYPSPKVSKI